MLVLQVSSFAASFTLTYGRVRQSISASAIAGSVSVMGRTARPRLRRRKGVRSSFRDRTQFAAPSLARRYIGALSIQHKSVSAYSPDRSNLGRRDRHDRLPRQIVEHADDIGGVVALDHDRRRVMVCG